METKKDPNEIEKLVELAQHGDTNAFAQIYEEFVNQIYKYIYFRANKEDALDLTENVFLKVWENLKLYKTGRNYFTSWIYKIAHNVIVDSYRKNRDFEELEPNLADDKKESDPVLLAERKLSQATLSKAISKLSKRYQQVLVLKYINDLENNEIADIMRKNEGSVRILKFRALKALKQVLAEMGINY